jgi:hypothetical protein
VTETWTLIKETKEWVGPITVTVDGVPTTSFEVAVVLPPARPATWTTPTLLDGDYGVLVGEGSTYPLTVGKKYAVYVRHTDSPEIPVELVGHLKVR